MIEVFKQGGPIMWPLLLTSVVALGVILERVWFLSRRENRGSVLGLDELLSLAQQGRIDQTLKAARLNDNFLTRIVVAAATAGSAKFTIAVQQAASRELRRFADGLSVLDSVITLAPLLGLLGTVTGMIGAFGLLGGNELDTPSAITGGIAEALIATAFGLGIAIAALVPFNYLTSRLEQARLEIEDLAGKLETILTKNSESLHENIIALHSAQSAN